MNATPYALAKANELQRTDGRSDDVGGLRFRWEYGRRTVVLYIPRSERIRGYLFHMEGNACDISFNPTREAIAERLEWLHAQPDLK